jgi:hypothetical protein
MNTFDTNLKRQIKKNSIKDNERIKIYKKMFSIEKLLTQYNCEDLNFTTLSSYSFDEHENIEDILRYIISNKNKDLLLFTPRFKILITNLIDEYEEIENANFHTLNRFLVMYNTDDF